MKKVLLQLDTDEHPSPFDAIVAHDAGVDVLLSHGGIEPEIVRELGAGRVLHPRDGRSQDDGGVGRRQARVRRREGLRRSPEGVLRSVQGLGDARLQRLQHDRGHDDRADREGAQPRRAAARSCSAWERSACARPCCCRTRAARSPSPRFRPTCSTTIASIAARTVSGSRRSSASTSASRPTGASSRRSSTGRRSCSPPGPPACRCCDATSGRSTRRSNCWPTTTPRSRWASRARRRPTTSPTTTASSCSARWRSVARR